MRRLSMLTFVAVFAMAFIGCDSTANSNVANNTRANGNANANSNVALVVNNNSNMVNSNMASSNRWNANITREEYDKEKDRYAKEAKDAGSTIGSGLNDGWLWTKTKSALATTNDLRDSTINVDVDNAVVTLKGSVANQAQKDSAMKVAKAIDGVKDVKADMLKVQAGDSMTNQMVNGNTATKNSNAK